MEVRLNHRTPDQQAAYMGGWGAGVEWALERLREKLSGDKYFEIITVSNEAERIINVCRQAAEQPPDDLI